MTLSPKLYDKTVLYDLYLLHNIWLSAVFLRPTELIYFDKITNHLFQKNKDFSSAIFRFGDAHYKFKAP